MPTNLEQIAELRYLAVLVRARQISQSTIASATGVHQSQISRILAGQARRTSKNVAKVCKYANSLQRQKPGDDSHTAEALCAALLRVWDGTQGHADALMEVLNALGTLQSVGRGSK